MPVRVRFPSRVPGGLLRVLLFLYSVRESFNRWRLGRVVCAEVYGRRLLRNLRHCELSSLKTSFRSPIPNTANRRLRLPSSACSALVCGGRSIPMVFVVSCSFFVVSCEFRMRRSLVIWQITFNRWRLGRVVCTEVCGRRLLRNLRHCELSSLKTSFQSPIPNTANLRLRLPSSACSALICCGRSIPMVFVVSCSFL